MSEQGGQISHEQLEVRINEVEHSLHECKEAIAQRFDEVAKATQALENEQKHKAALEQQLNELRQELAEAAARQTTFDSANADENEEVMQLYSQLLRDSDLFDAEWYLATYPDVRTAGAFAQAPHEHYLRYGALEGRNPCPEFDSSYYLEQYADVAEAGTNPLVHYLLYGRQEGRHIYPPFEGM